MLLKLQMFIIEIQFLLKSLPIENIIVCITSEHNKILTFVQDIPFHYEVRLIELLTNWSLS